MRRERQAVLTGSDIGSLPESSSNFHYSSPYSIPMNFSMTIDFVLQIITEYPFIPTNKKEEFRLLLNHNLVKIVSQKNVNPVLL